jgi:PAS domain S-box-containing protein
MPTRADNARGPARWQREFPAEPVIVGEVRRAVADFARAHGAPDAALDNITLAVSEATTNAVMHAFVGLPAGRVSVTAEAGDGCLLVRVSDDGRGMTPRSDSPGLGLGLTMMASMASRCDIREGPFGRGTEVRMLFDAPGVAGPALGMVDVGDDDRFELLIEVERLADAAGWPGEGIEQLVDLIVPGIADACTLDVVDESGAPRRLAARVGGTRGAELSAFLASRRPTLEQIDLTVAALRAGEPRVIAVDATVLRALAHDDADAERLAGMELAYWVNLPLHAADRLLGSLGLGLRAERPAPAEQMSFLRAFSERASRGLANTQLLSELRRTHRRLERILGALAEAVTVHDEHGKLVYANPAAAALLGADSVDELLAAEPGELAARFVITREDGSPVRESDFPGHRLVAGDHAPPLLTRSIERRTGREYWLLTKATLLDDEGMLAVNIIEDVTEAKTAERRQQFFAEAGELLASTLDYEQTLQHVASLVVPTLADWCAIDLLDDDGRLERVALHHADPAKRRLGREMQRRYPPDLEADAGFGPTLREGRPQLHPDISVAMLEAGARDAEHLQLLRQLGMRSAMILPLRARDRTIGALTLVTAESRRAFNEDDLAFAQDVARRTAVAVENSRRHRDRG